MRLSEMREEVFGAFWETVDWAEAEERLFQYQREIYEASRRHAYREARNVSDLIMGDLSVRCLAVRHVANSGSGPGVDRVRWTEGWQMMEAALSLDPWEFKASPQRDIAIVSRNTGKERHTHLPTYFDRSMIKMLSLCLAPIEEAHADELSFFARPGRSAQDVHWCVMHALAGRDAPGWVVRCDVRAYYANVCHGWLMRYLPVNKHALKEILDAGVVRFGEMFPSDGRGISEGSGLSPIIGNFLLDGLQEVVRDALSGGLWSGSDADGAVIRFADDFIIPVSGRDAADAALSAVRSFLAERGLELHPQKTCVRRLEEGFTFLSREYRREGGVLHARPSEDAVSRMVDGLSSDIESWKKSQRKLIAHLNARLRGWASYHRVTEASEAFDRIDAAVQAALVQAAVDRHPRARMADLTERYWFREADGSYSYSLPEDRTVKVVHLADTPLIGSRPLRTWESPYGRPDYYARRAETAPVAHASGAWAAVMRRQGGRCAYCGEAITQGDQPMAVGLDGTPDPSDPKTARYIHLRCLADEFALVWADLPAEPYGTDVLRTLEELAGGRGPTADVPSGRWRYRPLHEWFQVEDRPTVRFTFGEVEVLIEGPLPKAAREELGWWGRSSEPSCISRAWTTEGYRLDKVDLKKEVLVFRRGGTSGSGHVALPGWLRDARLCPEAKAELETFYVYFRKKYGL